MGWQPGKVPSLHSTAQPYEEEEWSKVGQGGVEMGQNGARRGGNGAEWGKEGSNGVKWGKEGR